MSEKELQGLVVFYINVYPELGQQIETTVQLMKTMNKQLVQRLLDEGGYLSLFVPTTKEATRVEKVDYDAPFPRSIAGSTDVEWQGLIVEKKPKYKFLGDVTKAESKFQGIINLYINFHPEMVDIDHDKMIEAVRSLNEETFQKISEDGRYEIMVIPTTKEATRIDKVDFEFPFPRFVPKSVKAKLVLLPADNDEEEDEEPVEENNE